MAVFAQTSPADSAGASAATTSGPVDTAGYRGERSEHHHYGWIGLLGLLGLAGLMRRGPERCDVYDTTERTGAGSSDVRR